MSEKVCTKCKTTKPFGSFSKSVRMSDGLASWCKPCHSAYERDYRERKKKEALLSPAEVEQLLLAKQAKAKASKERKTAYKKMWATENSERVSALQRASYLANREKRRAKAKARYESQKDQILLQMRQYAKRHKDQINERFKARYRARPEIRLSAAMRGMLSRVLNPTKVAKSGRTSELLGYCRDKLIQRLQAQFLPGMSWDNYGKWHIDHKIPVSHFLSKGETRPYLINALCNLQPLWAEDNWRKHSKHPRELRNADNLIHRSTPRHPPGSPHHPRIVQEADGSVV